MNLDQQISNILDKSLNSYKEDSPEYFIQNILDKLVVKTSDKYPKSIFYFLDDKVYLEITNNKDVWCRYDNFWYILHIKFLLNNDDSHSFMKNMLETYFKNKIDYLITSWSHNESKIAIEQYFKNN